MNCEVKTDNFFSDHSVCQTVGYFMATQYTGSLPPLGIAMTQTQIRFIFFPYAVPTDTASSDFYSKCFASSSLENC